MYIYYPKLHRLSSTFTPLDILILSNKKGVNYAEIGVSRTSFWRARSRIASTPVLEPSDSRTLFIRLPSAGFIRRYGLAVAVYHEWRRLTRAKTGREPNLELAHSLLGFSKRSLIKYKRISDNIFRTESKVIDLDELKSRISKKHKEKLLSKKPVASNYAALFKAIALQYKQSLIPPTAKDIAIAKRIDNLLRQSNSSLAALMEYAFEFWPDIQQRCRITTVPSMTMILRHYKVIFEMMDRPKAEIVPLEPKKPIAAAPPRRSSDQMSDDEIDQYNREAM